MSSYSGWYFVLATIYLSLLVIGLMVIVGIQNHIGKYYNKTGIKRSIIIVSSIGIILLVTAPFGAFVDVLTCIITNFNNLDEIKVQYSLYESNKYIFLQFISQVGYILGKIVTYILFFLRIYYALHGSVFQYSNKVYFVIIISILLAFLNAFVE